MLTVKQLARLAGVTPRTLHHYDAIGLLRPTEIGANGYRYYGEEALLRLQQILFYRELGLPLSDIQATMGRPDFDVLRTLEGHRGALQRQAGRLERLIKTVDQTILYLKGRIHMSADEFFAGFSDEEQAKYEKEAMQMYDPETVRASAKKWKDYSAAEKVKMGEEAKAVYTDLLAAIPKGPASAEAQAAIARWRHHIEYFWVPNEEQLVGLTELYNADPRFRANFDKLSPELVDFMRAAVKIYVERLPKTK
jgi:DNA-binding transcriptional MerR regulator